MKQKKIQQWRREDNMNKKGQSVFNQVDPEVWLIIGVATLIIAIVLASIQWGTCVKGFGSTCLHVLCWSGHGFCG